MTGLMENSIHQAGPVEEEPHLLTDAIFDELPTLWAVGGCTRQAGRTTLSAALGGLLAARDYAVELIRPDFFFDMESVQPAATRLSAAETGPILSRLQPECLSSIELMLDKWAAHSPDEARSGKKQIILDLNASLSHHTLDLFLASDARLVIIEPSEQSQRDLDVFLNACYLRWLELTLQEHDESLHDLFSALQQRRSLHQIDHLDFFDSHKMRQAIRPIPIQLVLNKTRTGDEAEFLAAWRQKCQHGLYANTLYLGQLFFDKQSATLLSAMRVFFNQLFHHDRLDVFRSIEKKMAILRQLGETGPAGGTEPLNTWPYTVLDGKVVLNLDPADFDESTTQSDFSALDKNLFE